MKILNLTLKTKWFNMVGNGKEEEYRDLSAYWIKRFIEINYPEETDGENKVIPPNIIYDIEVGHDPKLVLKSYYSKLKSWDKVLFANGGHFGNVPKKTFEFKGIEIREGKPEWGAEPGKKYFVIKLGKQL